MLEDVTAAERREPRFDFVLVILTTSFLVSGIDRPWALTVSLGLTTLLTIVAFITTGVPHTRPAVVLFASITLGATLLIGLIRNDSTWRAVPMFMQVGVLTVIVLLFIRAALRRDVVDGQTIMAALSAYVLIGFVYAWLYLAVDVVDDSQFSMSSADGTEFFTFSYVVQTTLGFGNQVPTAAAGARIVATQAVLGQIFLATLVARLVALYGRRRDTPPADPDAS